MTARKPRHLHAVPTKPGADVVSLQRAAEVLQQRHAHLAYQHQHSKAAAQAPDVVKEIETLVSKAAYRVRLNGADVTGLLTALATEMYVMGHVDGSDPDRADQAGATLAAIIQIEDIERRIRDEAITTAEAGA